MYGGDNQYGRTQKFVPKAGADPNCSSVGPGPDRLDERSAPGGHVNPEADGSPRHRRRARLPWYRSLYGRVAIGYAVLLPLLLVGSGRRRRDSGQPAGPHHGTERLERVQVARIWP